MPVIDIYVRVSRVSGREGDSFKSPEEQERLCRAQLVALGHDVGRVYIDLDQTGTTMSRPEFDRLMDRIRSGQSDGMVVSKLNRLARKTTAIDTILEIEKVGAKFICIEPTCDTSTPTGR